jgi:hypothetical protein
VWTGRCPRRCMHNRRTGLPPRPWFVTASVTKIGIHALRSPAPRGFSPSAVHPFVCRISPVPARHRQPV